MIRTQISLTDHHAERLRVLALTGGLSQAAIIREALDGYLRDHESRMRLERARRAVGAYRSGRKSTAEDHDEALDEAFGT